MHGMHGLNEMRCDDDTGRRCDAIDDDFDSIDSRRTARGSTRSVPSATRGGGDARARERRCIIIGIIGIFIFIFIIIGRRGETGGGARDRGIQTRGRCDADEGERATGDDVHRTFGDVPVVVFGGRAVDARVRRRGGGGGDDRRVEVVFERDGVVGGER